MSQIDLWNDVILSEFNMHAYGGAFTSSTVTVCLVEAQGECIQRDICMSYMFYE